MSIFDLISRAIWLNKSELFYDIRKKLCKHELGTYIDDSIVCCKKCDADLHFLTGDPYEDYMIEPHDI